MTLELKHELVSTFVSNYIISKIRNQVYNRENSQEYSYDKGKLIGLLTAFELNLTETDDEIIITYQSNNKIFAQYKISDLV